MLINQIKPKGILLVNSTFKIIFFIFIIILTSCLDAIVDTNIHPDSSFFNQEHLIIGITTGIVCAILFGLVLFYTHYLEQSLIKINILESILPICSNCKKIRIPGGDPKNIESWQHIESYITRQTKTQFSHTICPECKKKLYPDL